MTGLPRPAAVIFDLGGVVFDSPLALIRDYEQRRGLPAGFIARIVGGYGGADGAWHRLERGELTLAEFCARFDADVAAAGESISTATLMREMRESAAIRPVMIDAIRALRRAGLKVGALTNNWVTHEGYDEEMAPLRSEFHAFVESCKVKIRKPDPRIYAIACERLKVEPTAAVFLDDIGGNLKAARALGMTTIKVEEPAAAIAELERVVGLTLG